MIRVMAVENGVPSFYPAGVTLTGAAEQWARANGATALAQSVYGTFKAECLTVTFAVADGTERKVDFVQAIG
jgi:hypothetical protein